MASCRIYLKACWYDAESCSGAQNSSVAEFFMRVILGRVWTEVDLEDRTRAR